MLEITYYGHAFFQIEGPQGTILLDPYITGNPAVSSKPEDFRPNAILVTHGHEDHLGDAVSISKRSGAAIVVPYELATYCQRKGTSVHPMHFDTFDLIKTDLQPFISGIKKKRGVKARLMGINDHFTL